MRESAKGERTHLPSGAYEEWLKSQRARAGSAKRGKRVPADSLEAWLKERVERKVGHGRKKKRVS